MAQEEVEAHALVEDDAAPIGGEDVVEESDDAEEEAPAEFDEDREVENPLGLFVDRVDDMIAAPMEPPDCDIQPAGGADPAGEAQSEAPPPPPPAAEAARLRQRGHGQAIVVFPFGRISYYASKHAFEAVCMIPEHGKCVLTRTSRARSGTEDHAIPKGGRPVGLLAAWLRRADQCHTKDEHWTPELLRSLHADRLAGREFVRAAQTGEELLSLERPRKEGEPEEPESLEGYF